MSNTVKSRFAGLFRSLWGRKDQDTTPAGMEHRPVTSSAPASENPDEAMSDFPAPSALNAPLTRSHGEPAAGSETEIAVPLNPIVASLPMELRAKIISVPQPGTSIRLSVDSVVPQLAYGVVKISFGDLRHLAPGIFSNSSSSELDGKSVRLPLNEILSRLNPSLLERRSTEKIEVDEGIKGPFAGRGRGVAFTTEPLKATPPKPTLKPAIATPSIVPPRAITPVAPRSNPPTNIPSAPIPFRPQQPVAPTPNRVGSPSANFPSKANGNNGQNGPNGTNGSNGNNGNNGSHGGNGLYSKHSPIVPSIPKTPPSPVPSAPVPAPAAPREEPVLPAIVVGLWDLAESWPDELKEEISRSDIANANLPLAGKFVNDGLKRGRLTMTWKEIRLLAKPSSTATPNDSLELELPLKVIAPLFFAAQKNLPTAKRSVNVSSEIPNLFFGFPQSNEPGPLKPPQPQAPATRATAPPTPAGVSAFNPAEQTDNKAGNTNYYVWGDDSESPNEETNFGAPSVPKTDFTSRRAMPKDVVEKAVGFRGVAGALVTLPDGLRVASNVPVELNADTIAAFIPQIFERMNQSARELRMGALNNISFTVGNVPWRIFRVNSVYLAAFGRAGESLPAADLAALASELDRKK